MQLPLYAPRRYIQERRCSSTHSEPQHYRKLRVAASRPGCFIRKKSQLPLKRWSPSQYGRLRQEENLCLYRESNHNFSDVQFIASSLYRPCYPVFAVLFSNNGTSVCFGMACIITSLTWRGLTYWAERSLRDRRAAQNIRSECKCIFLQGELSVWRCSREANDGTKLDARYWIWNGSFIFLDQSLGKRNMFDFYLVL